MCIAILQSKSQKVTEQEFRNCWNRNNDGVGYSFVKNGQIKTKKFMKLNPFLNAIKSDVKRFGNASPFLIHFRYTTHGLTNIKNCHPFKVNEKQSFIHNGCINGVDDDKIKSDTRIFNEQILRNLPSNWTDNQSIVKLVQSFIGYSKLVFLNDDKSFKIINESLGHWNRNIWFSNDSYKDNKIKFKVVKNYNPIGYDYFRTESKTKSEKCDYCLSSIGVKEYKNQNLCTECSVVYDEQLEQIDLRF